MRNFMLTVCLFIILASPALAGTDEWLRKAGQAAQTAARGDVQGAAYQALPSAHLPLEETHLYANVHRVGVSRPILPAQKMGGLPYYLNGTYNASLPVQTSSVPRPNQNISVGVNGKYVSHYTTFSPDR